MRRGRRVPLPGRAIFTRGRSLRPARGGRGLSLANRAASPWRVADGEREAAGAAAAAGRHGAGRGPGVVAEYQRLLEDAAVEAVLIAAPSNLHAELIVAAAAAGKPIFCEKPIALTLEDADRAVA